jgi:hypothetical protein
VMAAPARPLRCRSLAYLVPIGAVAPPRARARAGGSHHAGHGSDPDRLVAVSIQKEASRKGAKRFKSECSVVVILGHPFIC